MKKTKNKSLYSEIRVVADAYVEKYGNTPLVAQYNKRNILIGWHIIGTSPLEIFKNGFKAGFEYADLKHLSKSTKRKRK